MSLQLVTQMKNSPFFATMELNSDKFESKPAATIPGVNLIGDISKTQVARVGAGMYFDKARAVLLQIGTGKEKLTSDGAPNLPADNKVKELSVTYKQVTRLSSEAAFGFIINLKNKNTNGEDGEGGKKDETAKLMKLETDFYIDKMTGIGVQYEKNDISDKYIPSDVLLGNEKTITVGINKYFSQSTSVFASLHRSNDGNTVTGDSSGFNLGLKTDF